ncbi:MAG: hypothetical protein AAFY35_12035 [Pseudomonadota bacterium]
MAKKETPFFVGYAPMPHGLKGFLGVVAVALIAVFAAAAWAISTSQDDPGPGAFRFDYGPQTLIGVLELTPEPMLHVTEGTERVPTGQTIMLSSGNKNGLGPRGVPLDGQMVSARGIVLERGSLNMLQVQGRADALVAVEDVEAPPLAYEDLGRWRLTGEICDGKCLAGAMRPGRGLAHKACANLCIIGGVPPVFVSTQPVAGTEFLMLGGQGRSDRPQVMLDMVGEYVTLEGQVEKRGDLVIFTPDYDTAVRP